MTEQKATNIKWQPHSVTKEDRQKQTAHKGAVLWFTGLPASGKSTLAFAVENALIERGHHAYVLDGDNIRRGLNKDLGFSPEDRKENIRRIGEVAHLFADAGVIAITASISPYARDRQNARKLNPHGKFVEIYCHCPAEACKQRDPKGLYKKACCGEIKDVTGVDAPYESPPNAEVTVHTDKETVEESTDNILKYLETAGIFQRNAAG